MRKIRITVRSLLAAILLVLGLLAPRQGPVGLPQPVPVLAPEASQTEIGVSVSRGTNFVPLDTRTPITAGRCREQHGKARFQGRLWPAIAPQAG